MSIASCRIHAAAGSITAICAAALLSIQPIRASAADPATPSSPSADLAPGDAGSLTLGQVGVTASRPSLLSSRRLAASVDLVNADVVQARSVEQSWELFSAVPGVMLTEFRQGTTSGKPSFRGFNGEGNINAVKLLIDGIPSNSNDGNMPYLDMVSPLEIERIEVVRGTNDPRWGLHAIAGHAQVITRQGGNDGAARVSVGQFGAGEVQVAKALQTDTGWQQNYFLGVRRSAGYRDHAESDKRTFAGKWFYEPQGSGWRAGVVARSHEAHAEEPGYLTLLQRRDDRRQSATWSATDDDLRRMNQLSLHAEGEGARGVAWTARAWRNELDDRRYVRFSSNVSQQERLVQETHRGMLGNVTWRLHPALQLEAGVQREWQDNASVRYLTANQERQSQTRDQAFALDSTGAYVQAVIKPHPAWTVLPGWRVDRFSGRLVDGLKGQTFPANDYGNIRQPKLSVVYAPAKAHSLYANWGRTFQIGVGAASYLMPPRTTDLAPSINEGWELGWKFRVADWLEGRLASWTQIASDEVYRRLNDPSNDSANLGRTRRDGQDLQLNARLQERLSAWGSVTLQRARIVDPDPSAPLTRGKEVDHVPHALAALGVRWQPRDNWEGTLAARAQSSYHLDQTNSHGRFGQFVVADLQVRHRWSPTLAVDLQIRNLFDRRHEYVWWDGSQSLHAPADGRAVTVAAQLGF
jgi:iron complex outermembrane receptor protein